MACVYYARCTIGVEVFGEQGGTQMMYKDVMHIIVRPRHFCTFHHNQDVRLLWPFEAFIIINPSTLLSKVCEEEFDPL